MQPEDERIAALLKMAGPRAAVPAGVTLRVRSAAHDAWSDAVRSSSRRRTAMWAAAAAAVLVISLQIPKNRVSSPAPRIVADVQFVRGGSMGSNAAIGAVVTTAADGMMTLHWREHGSLRLAASTVVRFDDADAITLQRGAVYFSSDARTKPVAVRTKFGTVHDIGTQFEARLDTASLRVRVREGRVEVNGHDAEAGTELVAASDGVKKNSIPTAGADWNWVIASAPPMTLEGNARDVLAAIAREKGLKLIFTDRVLADSVNRMSLKAASLS